MGWHTGFITGFIFGVFGIIVPSIAFSRILDVLIPFFAPFPLLIGFIIWGLFSTAPLQTQANYFSILLPLGILLNGAFFGLIGFLIQKYLRATNKNENIVIYIFLAIIIVFVLVGLLECTFVENCGAQLARPSSR